PQGPSRSRGLPGHSVTLFLAAWWPHCLLFESSAHYLWSKHVGRLCLQVRALTLLGTNLCRHIQFATYIGGTIQHLLLRSLSETSSTLLTLATRASTVLKTSDICPQANSICYWAGLAVSRCTSPAIAQTVC
ncbi:hypothetical protein FOMPIDRAFT_162075, partial [Fomitopsis schrenkii]